MHANNLGARTFFLALAAAYGDSVLAAPIAGGYPVPDTAKAAVVVVSDAQGKAGFVTSFVKEVLKAVPDDKVAIVVNGSDDTAQQVLREIKSLSKEMYPDPALAQRKAAEWAENIHSVNAPWHWSQDFFETIYEPKTKTSHVRMVQNYYTGQATKTQSEVSNAFSRIAQKNPKIKLGSEFDFSKISPSGGNRRMGGNFEGLPGGGCLIGNDNLSTPEFERIATEVCGGNLGEVVQVPTDFLNVGHTDEVVKVIPTGDAAPCNFAFLIASPSLGLSLLKDNAQEKSVLFKDIPMTENTSRASGTRALLGLCYQVQRDRFKSKPQEEMPNPKPIPEHKETRFWDLLVSPSMAGATRENDTDVVTRENRYQFDPNKCGDLTNGDLYNSLLNEPEIIEFNKMVEQQLDLASTEIAAKMKAKFPKCSPKFVKVPDIFYGYPRLDEAGKKTTKGASADSIFPNPTNSVVMGKTIISSDPGNQAFDLYLKNTYASLGLKYSTIDTFFAHRKDGNLHCSSNVLRVEN